MFIIPALDTVSKDLRSITCKQSQIESVSPMWRREERLKACSGTTGAEQADSREVTKIGSGGDNGDG